MLLGGVPGDHAGLPPPGSRLGWTKDSCVRRVAGARVVDSMPPGCRLRFDRWGGVVRMSNTWLLFVNFFGQAGGGGGGAKYRNAASGGGRRITYTLSPGRPTEGELLEYLGAPDDGTKVLLFAKGSNKEKFMFCGECGCAGRVDASSGSVAVTLDLLDFDRLAAGCRRGSVCPLSRDDQLSRCVKFNIY